MLSLSFIKSSWFQNAVGLYARIVYFEIKQLAFLRILRRKSTEWYNIITFVAKNKNHSRTYP